MEITLMEDLRHPNIVNMLGTLFTLSLHCCHTFVALWLHYCHTFVALLLLCSRTIVALLLHCYNTVRRYGARRRED
jgi:hypothetical protein